MNASLHKTWTQEEFFAWAEKQDQRYEFDGAQPVAMTGGTVNAGFVMRNLHGALFMRMRGGGCTYLGPDHGLATVGKIVRYPDAVITGSKQEGNSHLVSGVIVVFEIVSPSSFRDDHFVKVREYAAVPTIRRYVIIESTSVDVTVMERQEPNGAWLTSTLTDSDTVQIPEVGIEIPVIELYDGVSFTGQAGATV